jgi:hypothetical protein
VDKARAFYEGLLGWTFVDGPGGQGLVITGLGVGAGIHGSDEGASPYVFFRVDDIDAAVARVQELGGMVDDIDVEGDEASVSVFGRFRLCKDDQGSAFGLHQPPLPM